MWLLNRLRRNHLFIELRGQDCFIQSLSLRCVTYPFAVSVDNEFRPFAEFILTPMESGEVLGVTVSELVSDQ